MSTPTLAPTTIEHLDFDAALPCQMEQHSEWGHTLDAGLLVEVWHNCGRHRYATLCVDCWAKCGTHGVYCGPCDECGLNRDDWMRIVEVLR